MYYVYRKGITDRDFSSNKFGGRKNGGRRGNAGASSGLAGTSQSYGGQQTSERRRPAQQMRRQSRNGGRGRKFEQQIDIARFVNRAVVTETAEHFVPEHGFTDFAVDERLKQNIAVKNYVTPSPIQDRAIPHVLQGHDVVGIANTGTGKTAAFLVPLIDKVLKNRAELVLIVVPTRELAIQIDEEFQGFATGLHIRSAVCVGGASMGKQIADLRRNPNFIIGTPGRLKDHMERKFLDLAKFRTVVLDEADRMLDMGFIADMRFMLSKMPAERHTLFFSATISKEIEGLIHEFLKDPVSISVKTGDTSKNVDQDVVRIAGRDKLDVLHGLLTQPEMSKVLIFGRTKHGVEKLARLLMKRGVKVESIHGNKSHSQRQRALGSFKGEHVQVLIATDVAARGLDISGVSHVINYDVPATYDDYVHRIGRTGRAGNSGKALTFVD